MGRFIKWSLVFTCMMLAACSPKVEMQTEEEEVTVQETLDKDQEIDTTESSTTAILDEPIIPWSSERKMTFRLDCIDEGMLYQDYLTTGIYQSNYTAYDADIPVEVDLDGDGTLEKVMYTLTYPEEDNPYKVLYVNDTLYEVKIACSPLPQFAIVDIDTSDAYKEMVISDYGPSDDYKSGIYRYKDGKLEEVGWVEGLFNKGLGIDGKGNVMARTRSQILQTWYMGVPYKLVEGTLEVSADIFTTNHPVFLQEPLPVFKSNDEKSQMFTIQEGVEAVLTATDDKMWCRIETEDGQIGWFRLDENDQMVDSETHPVEIFAGLTFYD